MTTRNNEDRIGPQTIDSEPTAALNPLEFVAPTELVDIPSKGLLYPADHPLHGKEEIEIRYMTAKEEDILTSKTLLKKGVAIDRFLQNIIVDKNIKVNDLLIGDKNAAESRQSCPRNQDFVQRLGSGSCPAHAQQQP